LPSSLFFTIIAFRRTKRLDQIAWASKSTSWTSIWWCQKSMVF